MITRWQYLAASLSRFFVLSACVTCAVPGISQSPDWRSNELFDSSAPLRIEITIPTNALSQLTRTNHRYVEGRLMAGTNQIERVGFRLKGVSSFQPVNLKPSLAVKFDAFVPKQRLFGLSKVLLNNGRQDPFSLRERLANQLFEQAGVPTARTRPVRVSLNGRDLGIYLAVEAMNKGFLQRNFGDASGNLYEGFMQDIDGDLDLDNGTDVSRRDLTALRVALQTQDSATRRREAGSHLEIDRFMDFAALTVFLGHTDNYLANGNNYRVYHSPVTHKMVFIPHGLDTTFVCGGPVDPPPSGSIAMEGLYHLDDGADNYQSRARQLLTNVWSTTNLTSHLTRNKADIIELCATAKEQAQANEWNEILRAQVDTRRQEIVAALIQPHIVQARFGDEGTARLTNWFPVVSGISPWFREISNSEGLFLQIEAIRPASASWRTRVELPIGAYIFSCRTRSNATKSDSGNGFPSARICVAGGSVGTSLVKGGEWEILELPFDVTVPSTVLELVCQFESGIGEVLFDKASMHVRKKGNR